MNMDFKSAALLGRSQQFDLAQAQQGVRTSGPLAEQVYVKNELEELITHYSLAPFSAGELLSSKKSLDDATIIYVGVENDFMKIMLRRIFGIACFIGYSSSFLDLSNGLFNDYLQEDIEQIAHPELGEKLYVLVPQKTLTDPVQAYNLFSLHPDYIAFIQK